MIAAAKARLSRVEFTALLAAAMSMAALGIDLLLPAFSAIRGDLGLAEDSTAVAGLVTAYFLGMAIGQPFAGPISDAVGRKPVLWVGFGVYGVGALATAAAPTLPLLLVARFVWGLGAAAPRTITLAMVRDRFEGDQMSRTMSMIFSVFMLVPVVAPSLGAAGVAVMSWRWLFVACGVAVAALTVWTRRLQETLPPERRMPLRFGRLARAAKVVVSTRTTVGYGLAMTLMYGGFTSYLASSELFFGEVFGAADAFPLWFGGLAVLMGVGMQVNARLVERVGARRMALRALAGYTLATVVLVVVAVATGGRPPLLGFAALIAVVLVGHAIIIPNLNALAMVPMGAVAGTASAVIGAVQIAAGALLGSAIDRQFNGGITPFAVSLLALTLLAVACVAWADGSGRSAFRAIGRRAARLPAWSQSTTR